MHHFNIMYVFCGLKEVKCMDTVDDVSDEYNDGFQDASLPQGKQIHD